MSALTSTTLKLGDQAPNFTLTDLEGRPFELADILQGGSALLSFAPGVWSQTTRRQIDEFESAHRAFESARVIPLIVTTQHTHDARRSLHAHLANLDRDLMLPLLSFPILADPQRKAARDYGVYRAVSWDGIRVTRPAIFLIQPTGEIAFIYVGVNDRDVPQTENLLHLVTALTRPHVLTFTPNLLEADRHVQAWSTTELPHVEKAQITELSEGPVPMSLPSGRTDLPEPPPDDGNANGKEPEAIDLSKPIPLGPPLNSEVEKITMEKGA